ncbi:MAG: Mur ligase family protein [Marinilabiliales bacterium]|nr:Mur ligase family protein [Marinilabiliales bacterium]
MPTAAVAAGAIAAVVDDPPSAGEKLILVDDVLETLTSLAAYQPPQDLRFLSLPSPVSNGKTTTKELITAVLSRKARVHSTTGNFNNHIGVPLTLLSSPPDDAGFLVVEMGANHKGEIAGPVRNSHAHTRHHNQYRHGTY